MATMLINHMLFLTSLLIVVFPVANAIPARDIDKLCKETTDVPFCLKYLGTDPRIPAARDLTDVLLIAVMLWILYIYCNFIRVYLILFMLETLSDNAVKNASGWRNHSYW